MRFICIEGMEHMSEKKLNLKPMALVPGTNPVEVYWLLTCVVISVVAMFESQAEASSIESSFDGIRWAVYLWYGCLGIGSSLAAYGGLRKRTVVYNASGVGDESALRTGLLYYGIGWTFAASASLVYGVAIFGVAGWRGFVVGAMTFMWGLAGVSRSRQIFRLMKGKGGGRHL